MQFKSLIALVVLGGEYLSVLNTCTANAVDLATMLVSANPIPAEDIVAREAEADPICRLGC
jgi:hypothetical protein